MKGRVYRKEQMANLRSMKADELTSKAKAVSEELFWFRFKKEGGQLDKPTELRKAKKQYARMLTIQSESKKGKNKEVRS